MDNSSENQSPEFKPSGYGAFPTKPKITAKPKVAPTGNPGKKPASAPKKPVKQSGGPPAGVGIVLLVLISLAFFGAWAAANQPSKPAQQPQKEARRPTVPTPAPTPEVTPSPVPTPPRRFTPDNEVHETPTPRRPRPTPQPRTERENGGGRTTRNETPATPKPQRTPPPVAATPKPRATPKPKPAAPSNPGGRASSGVEDEINN